MKNTLIFFLSLLSSGVPFSPRRNWTFLPQLLELCPYSSFCEEKAISSFLVNDTISGPCCSSCSCKPGCEVYGNCCFDSVETEVLRKCTTPVVFQKNIAVKSYIMIHSCSHHLNRDMNNKTTLCEVNNTDFKSFAPVLSTQTGDIFVNSECAFCNNIYDIIPWEIAVECPMGHDDYSFDTLKLLQGENIATTECQLVHVPPKHTDLRSRECVTNAIRACNVTGSAMEWAPYWDYCPLFNATYWQNQNIHKIYANIFCYLCNERNDILTKTMCKDVDHNYKNPTSGPFTAILDGVNAAEEDVITHANSKTGCGPTEVLVQSFKTECRRVLCPWRQFRLGGKCGYYSKEWIGGPFTAILKLTPIDETHKIDISALSDIQPNMKYNKQTRWLKRIAMKAWNLAILYRPSVDLKYVEYLVAIASYPGSSVNPSRLRTILRRTLTETWQLISGNRTYRLQVNFHRYERYMKQYSTVQLLKETYDNDEEYVFENMHSFIGDSIDRYIFPIFDSYDVYTVTESNLNELFLCEQIELRSEEFQKHLGSVLLMITNETLSVTQYRSTDTGHFSICLNRFGQNSGFNALTSDNLYNSVFVGLLLVHIILILVTL